MWDRCKKPAVQFESAVTKCIPGKISSVTNIQFQQKGEQNHLFDLPFPPLGFSPLLERKVEEKGGSKQPSSYQSSLFKGFAH